MSAPSKGDMGVKPHWMNTTSTVLPAAGQSQFDPPSVPPQVALVPFANPPDAVVRELLTSARRLAIVGASSKPDRPSYGIARKMQAAGYEIVPVNPNEREVLGEKAYASLDEVEGPIDIVVVFRRSEHTPAIAEQTARLGARALWLQTGIVNDEAARIASGRIVVMDECIGVAHSRLRIAPKTSDTNG